MAGPVDPEAEQDGVVIRRWKILYRLAQFEHGTQTITLSAASESEAITRLRWQYPPDAVDVLTIGEVEA